MRTEIKHSNVALNLNQLRCNDREVMMNIETQRLTINNFTDSDWLALKTQASNTKPLDEAPIVALV